MHLLDGWPDPADFTTRAIPYALDHLRDDPTLRFPAHRWMRTLSEDPGARLPQLALINALNWEYWSLVARHEGVSEAMFRVVLEHVPPQTLREVRWRLGEVPLGLLRELSECSGRTLERLDIRGGVDASGFVARGGDEAPFEVLGSLAVKGGHAPEAFWAFMGPACPAIERLELGLGAMDASTRARVVDLGWWPRLRQVGFWGARPESAELVTELLARCSDALSALELHGGMLEALDVGALEHTSGVESLRLSHSGSHFDWTRTVMATESLTALRELGLHMSHSVRLMTPNIAAATHLRPIDALDLVITDMDDASLERWLAAPVCEGLVRLDLSSNAGLTDEGVRALAGADALGSLEELRFDQNAQVDPGLLVDAPFFQNLRVFRCSETNQEPLARRAILEALPVDTLEVLELGSTGFTDDDAGVLLGRPFSSLCALTVDATFLSVEVREAVAARFPRVVFTWG